jgi:dipeptidyl aminopeptidase/acylaminoacyl peptidase
VAGAARRALAAVGLLCAIALPLAAAAKGGLTLEQVKGYPYPSELAAAARASRIAWSFDVRGVRNVFVAESPSWTARRLTSYDKDDGQELTSIQLSADGRYVVYVRGGDHGSNWDDALPVNPAGVTAPSSVGVWSVPFEGGEPKLLGEGDLPMVSPRGDVVALEKEKQIWSAPLDGSSPAKKLFTARGENGGIEWAPDGSRFAFESRRDAHALVGVYQDATTPILWIAPSTSRDSSPRFSPDGKRLVFVRRPGTGGAPPLLLEPRHQPWSLWTADAATGAGTRLWTAPETLRGSFPTTHGEANLHWAEGGRVVFLSYQDGWPHLYSLPASGGEPLLLTPGDFMAEHVSLSPDRRSLVFAANAGNTPDDLHRRHVVRVPVDKAAPEVLTPGTGLEWSPVVTGDGQWVAYIAAGAQRPPLPAVRSTAGGAARLLGEDQLAADFAASALVTPRAVSFKSEDGVLVHGQLFEATGGGAKKPALVYVHGGPPRQMLLGWHYSDYYSNAYALNQYLASRGFAVLSVNYRLGIGFGYDFHRPRRAGPQGASEYLDVRAAGTYLRSLPQVDPARIGIYGGSYGGYLTALALARDSELFAAGVDVHGVHDWTAGSSLLSAPTSASARFEPSDREEALAVAWRSSPVSSVGSWRSPVLLIHADDDRNVHFTETVDLVRRLQSRGVPYEEMVVVDDTHHFLMHSNQLRVDRAIAEFLERKLAQAAAAPK